MIRYRATRVDGSVFDESERESIYVGGMLDGGRDVLMKMKGSSILWKRLRRTLRGKILYTPDNDFTKKRNSADQPLPLYGNMTL